MRIYWPDDDTASRRLTVTSQARHELAQLRGTKGTHTVLLSWPTGAVLLPADVLTPSRYDVILGHVSGCPLIVDLRQLDLFTEVRAVLDVRRGHCSGAPLARLHLVPRDAGQIAVASAATHSRSDRGRVAAG